MTTSKEFSACVAQYDPNALPVEAAQEIVCQWAMPRASDARIERVGLHDALGRVLAEDVISPINVPAFDNSAMDGYAFAGASLAGSGDTVDLAVAGTALAGRPFPAVPDAGQCVRIMTGASMPPGCDTVVPQELVTRDGDMIRFDRAKIRAGQNRRLSGEDLAKDKPALLAGRILRTSDLAVCSRRSASAKCRCASVSPWRSFPPATNCVRSAKH